MKRKEYLVTYNGISFIKFAWNAACKEIESVVGKIAKAERVDYHLIDSVHTRVDGQLVASTRTWRGDDGTTIVFALTKKD